MNLFSVTDAAATSELRARILADAIPAESHAAGANYLGVFNRDGNMSLMELMSNTYAWPENRKRTVDGVEQLMWQHSDFKNLAYFFVYQFFNEIVNEQ